MENRIRHPVGKHFWGVFSPVSSVCGILERYAIRLQERIQRHRKTSEK